MGMFVEEEVVTCRLFRDSHGQVFQLCRLSVAQPNQLLLSVHFLLAMEMKSLCKGCWSAMVFKKSLL